MRAEGLLEPTASASSTCFLCLPACLPYLLGGDGELGHVSDEVAGGHSGGRQVVHRDAGREEALRQPAHSRQQQQEKEEQQEEEEETGKL